MKARERFKIEQAIKQVNEKEGFVYTNVILESTTLFILLCFGFLMWEGTESEKNIPINGYFLSKLYDECFKPRGYGHIALSTCPRTEGSPDRNVFFSHNNGAQKDYFCISFFTKGTDSHGRFTKTIRFFAGEGDVYSTRVMHRYGDLEYPDEEQFYDYPATREGVDLLMKDVETTMKVVESENWRHH